MIIVRRLMVWRSPGDQPPWARPALLLVAVAAGLAYAWQMNEDGLEPYYAAAVRSMSMDWHNFAYGALDPAGTVTLDKLPGAFWLQALSLRLLGVHEWAVVLPQTIEGVLSVLVLYRAVRRLAGPAAGLAAAAVLAASPMTVALSRGNVSDSLLVLLLVLAADATSSALLSGRTWTLLTSGVLVGLAFQAKSAQAWLVLPALGLAHLAAAPGSPRRRLLQVGAAGLVTTVVSLSWMVLVALTPAGSRPYIDGSQHNSIFEQVFVYNGFGRLGGLSPIQLLATEGLDIASPSPPPGWNRLLTGSYGHAWAWLLPAVLVALVAGLVIRRREPRTDSVRACLGLWGTWLAVLVMVFSANSSGWSYYTAALAPATAALLGVGLTLAWRSRHSGRRPHMILAVVVGASVAYGAWLLPDHGTGLPGWLRPLLLVAGVTTEMLLVASVVSVRARGRLMALNLAGAGVAIMLVPVIASASIAINHLGPFDSPFEPEAVTTSIRADMFTRPHLIGSTIPLLERGRNGAPDLAAAQPGVVASSLIFYSGHEVLPIGGFTGTIPEPTLPELKSKVARGEFHQVLTSPSRDPRHVWIATHCLAINVRSNPQIYYCRPSDAQSKSPD